MEGAEGRGTIVPSPVQFPKKLMVVALIALLLLLDIGVAKARGAQVGRLDIGVGVLAFIALSFSILAARLWQTRSLPQAATENLGLRRCLRSWRLADRRSYGRGLCLLHIGTQPIHLVPALSYETSATTFDVHLDGTALPGIQGVSRYTTNSLGLRGPEPEAREGAYRIVTVGGSTTECTYLDDTETWQHLLMQRLNQQGRRRRVWIGSAGISGYPTVNHLRFVTESPLMKEVDALVFLVGANDFNQFLRGNLHDGVFQSQAAKDVQPIWRYSPIASLVRNRWQRRQSSLEAEDTAGNNVPRRRLRRQKATIRDSVPGLDQALREYEARIEALVSLSRKHGLRPIFLTQPTLWAENLKESAQSLLSYGDITDTEYLSVRAGREGIDKHNEVLLRVCRKSGAECISTAAMNGREEYYYDDFHFNEAGAAALSRIVADHLIRQSGEDWSLLD